MNKFQKGQILICQRDEPGLVLRIRRLPSGRYRYDGINVSEKNYGAKWQTTEPRSYLGRPIVEVEKQTQDGDGKDLDTPLTHFKAKIIE